MADKSRNWKTFDERAFDFCQGITLHHLPGHTDGEFQRRSKTITDNSRSHWNANQYAREWYILLHQRSLPRYRECTFDSCRCDLADLSSGVMVSLKVGSQEIIQLGSKAHNVSSTSRELPREESFLDMTRRHSWLCRAKGHRSRSGREKGRLRIELICLRLVDGGYHSAVRSLSYFQAACCSDHIGTDFPTAEPMKSPSLTWSILHVAFSMTSCSDIQHWLSGIQIARRCQCCQRLAIIRIRPVDAKVLSYRDLSNHIHPRRVLFVQVCKHRSCIVEAGPVHMPFPVTTC